MLVIGMLALALTVGAVGLTMVREAPDIAGTPAAARRIIALPS